MMFRSVIALALMVGVAQAQTIFVTTVNTEDLNPTPAWTGPVGPFRITATITDGVDPIDFSLEENGTTLRIINLADGFTNAPVSRAFVTNNPGTVRWLTGTLQAGSYQLLSSIQTDEGETLIFNRYLTVTSSTSSAGVTVNVTNNVSSATIESGAVQVAVSGLVIDLINIKSQSITNTGDMYIDGTLYAGGFNVTGELSFVDRTKVALVGETNMVVLTSTWVRVRTPTSNDHAATKGYVDSMSVGGITNLSLSGGLSGSLVGQLFYLTNTASAAASPFTESGGTITPTNANATLQLERLVVTNRITHGSAMNVNSGTRSSILGGGGNAASFTNFIDGSGTDSIIGAGYDNHIIASPQAMIGAGINNDIRNSSFAHNFGVNNFLNFASQGYMLSSDSRSVTTVAFTVIGGYWGNGATQSVSGVIIGDQNRVNRTTNAFVIGTQGGVSGLTNVVLVSAGGSRYEATSNNQFAVSAVSFLINSNHMLPIIVTNINNDGGTITTQRIQLLGRIL